MRKKTEAKDIYGNVINVGDEIVFSWGGKLSKAIVSSIKLGVRAALIVYPLDYNGRAYGYGVADKRKGAVTATVKDSMSAVKTGNKADVLEA